MTRWLALTLGSLCLVQGAVAVTLQPAMSRDSVPTITTEGLLFKDHNRNAQLDPYEDWRLPPSERAADLVARMTLPEKAGAMMHGSMPAVGNAFGGSWDFDKLQSLVNDKHILTLISRSAGDPVEQAHMANRLQALAERTRLGIPAVISSDPRNHFQYTAGASGHSEGFSQWPETTGLAAIGDPGLVRRFADIARQEYRAIGLTTTLSPMADIATEPRWPRINGTFGEDPELARQMVKAYVEGFQHGGDGLGPESVASVVKHWVGYSASANGHDGHNPYGTDNVFGPGQFEKHIIPFTGAFEAGVAGVMPAYTIPRKGVSIGSKPAEHVGASFSDQMVNQLLRGEHGFDGVVLTDWGVTSDCGPECQAGTRDMSKYGTPWGVEDLAVSERFAKAILAGVDQFGGVTKPEVIVELVERGEIEEARIDQSVARLMVQRFQQGLFENPYVDADAAGRVVGTDNFRQQALEAQRRSQVLLENRNHLLPLDAGEGRKVYLHGIDAETARAYGFTPVDKPAQADLAILRMSTPHELLHPEYFFGAIHHEGSLAFGPDNEDLKALQSIPASVPAVVSVYLDRPAVLTPVRERAAALLGNFGASDQALFDVLTGKARPEGRMPFELPSSMKAVEAQDPGAPHDTANPLYPIHYGLGYGD